MTFVNDVEIINGKLRIRIVSETPKAGIKMTSKHYKFNTNV